jgi:ABC-2 type transport system ATP-binding protein
MIGRLYQLGRREARRRADELIERLGLADAADRPARGYSGGMNRRLDLAAAIIGRAPVLFLDEPTTGLDPASRRDIWDLVRELVDDGTTLLLTTQYLDEADRLADRIAVIDRGAVIAEGTAEELKSRIGGGILELRPADPDLVEAAERALAGLGPTSRVEDERSAPGVAIPVGDDHALIARAVRAVDDAGIELLEVGVRRPSLDDVFLTLTRPGGRREAG